LVAQFVLHIEIWRVRVGVIFRVPVASYMHRI
jgi:hypothetical protein